MQSKYQEMLQERADLRVEGARLLDNEDRSEAEQARLDELTAQVSTLNANIEREERQRDVLRTLPSQGSMAQPVSRGMNELIRQAAGRA